MLNHPRLGAAYEDTKGEVGGLSGHAVGVYGGL